MTDDIDTAWERASSAKNAVDAFTSRIGELYMISEHAKSSAKSTKFQLMKEIDKSMTDEEPTRGIFEKIGKLTVSAESDSRVHEQSTMELVSARSLLDAFKMEFDKHVEAIVSMSDVQDGSYVLDFENRKVIPNG